MQLFCGRTTSCQSSIATTTIRLACSLPILLVSLSISSHAQEGRVIISSSVNGVEVPPSEVQGMVAPMLSGGSLSFFPSMLPDDPLGMLQRKPIQQELDLEQDQIALVKELQSDIQRQTQEIFATQAKFGGDAARMVETANKAVRKNIEKELKEILSFKQLKRLGQLEIQMKLRNRGIRAFVEEKLAKQLAISDDQKKTIQKEARQSQTELEEEIRKLRQRFRKRAIRDVLEDDQLRKLEELTGDEYEAEDSNIRRFPFEVIGQ